MGLLHATMISRIFGPVERDSERGPQCAAMIGPCSREVYENMSL